MSPPPTVEPLAARLRPRTLDEVVGQRHLLGPRAPFRRAIEAGVVPSALLWGPPGCGKTTIARLLAHRASRPFVALSAVTSGIRDLREVIDRARGTAGGVLLFVDEIHRWNKAQQDALLPHVEDGLVTLVGATTENPAFEVIPALRSRCWLLVLEPVSEADLAVLLERGVAALGRPDLRIEKGAIEAIAAASSGDARRALSTLERAAAALPEGASLDAPALSGLLGRDLLHDAAGDAHYDVVSAFIKSLRGSDPQAAVYWLARLLEGGEDPMFAARRMVVFAAEDVGNADPRALPLAVAAMQGVHMVGMPEARILLGQAATWLACSPKSNAAYRAIDAAIAAVRETGALPVPLHLRNAPTGLARSLGHGAEYRYPHDYPDHVVDQDYLPPALAGAAFYQPVGFAGEKVIAERLEWWRRRLRERG